jgi:hypothetical protein
MAFIVNDRVRETTATTGTGTVTLAGAVSGYQSFSAIGNGNNTYYTIANRTASEWETGVGTYTSSGTTLSRDFVISSSANGGIVDFSAGTKDVFCSVPAARTLTSNASNPTAGTFNAVKGIVPSYIIYSNGANVSLSATSAAQAIYPSLAQLSLFSSTQYQFEYMFIFSKTTTTTSHTCGFGFSTNGVGNSIWHTGYALSNTTAPSSVGIAPWSYTSNTFAIQVLSGSLAAATTFFAVTGVGTLNTGPASPGLLTPQFKTSTSIAGYSVLAGSYIKLTPDLGVYGAWA